MIKYEINFKECLSLKNIPNIQKCELKEKENSKEMFKSCVSLSKLPQNYAENKKLIDQDLINATNVDH